MAGGSQDRVVVVLTSFHSNMDHMRHGLKIRSEHVGHGAPARRDNVNGVRLPVSLPRSTGEVQ